MKFLCYTNSRGNIIQQQFEILPLAQQQFVYAQMELLPGLSKDVWHRVVKIQGVTIAKKAYFEISFSLGPERKQHRIVGYFTQNNEAFVMIDWFEKHSSKSENKHRFDVIARRRKEIDGNEKGLTHEYYFKQIDILSETVH